MSSLYAFGSFFVSLYCQVSAVTFQQSPPQLVAEKSQVQINCSHNDGNLALMLWYQHMKENQSMTLIGYGYQNTRQTFEGQFEEQFKLTRGSATTGTLTIPSAELSHSAVYFCAARQGGAGAEAYFGGGTKLTVLEKGSKVTPPQEVKILGPSEHECRNGKDKKRKKTLVCVASGFYPDHVKVYWHMNEKNVTDGVATDEAARELKDDNNKTVYKITSRLRVYAKQWENPKNTFKCTVGFINANGKETPHHSNTITGVQADTKSMSREKYLTATQNFKVVYSVLTVKSCAYGAFVGFLVWKLQRFGGKQKY